MAGGSYPGQNNWKFFVQLNGWLPDITVGTADGEDVEIGIDDIIDNLDLTLMGTFIAKKDKWSFLTDVVYLDLNFPDNQTIVDNALLGMELNDMGMQTWIVTPMVSYNVLESDRLSLDFMAGVRYIWLEIDTEIQKRILSTTSDISSSNSGDHWNGIIGVRGHIDLSGKWYIPFHFDAGTGDSSLTWQAYAAVAYRFKTIDLTIGYRHLEFDIDEDDAGGNVFDYIEVSGPMIGIKYAF
jgi:hypothetical protein